MFIVSFELNEAEVQQFRAANPKWHGGNVDLMSRDIVRAHLKREAIKARMRERRALRKERTPKEPRGEGTCNDIS